MNKSAHALLATPESWASVSKKAFWDREVPLQRWREKVGTAHPSYLPASIANFLPREFIRFYGADEFTRHWPTLRASLPESSGKHLGMYDLAWSQLAGGGWNLRPTPDFFELPEKRRAFLVQVAKFPGKSIYEIAKDLGLQYRRAHDHAKWLAQSGKIKRRETTAHNRRKSCLYPAR